MDKVLRNILLNSTLAFVSAFVITTLIHEWGHFISYFLFDGNPILYHNHVRTPDQQLAAHATVISALAGPVSSLIQGIIFGAIVTRRGKGNAAYLVFLWLGLLGFINFFGYLMMTPLSTAGDTGKAAELLQIDFVYRILIAVGGFAVLILAILKLGRNFARFIPPGENDKGRVRYVYHIMFFPILIGCIINTLLALPAPALLSIIYPATSPFVIMISFSAILKSGDSAGIGTEIEAGVSKSMIFLFLFAILVNRILTAGFG